MGFVDTGSLVYLLPNPTVTDQVWATQKQRNSHENLENVGHSWTFDSDHSLFTPMEPAPDHEAWSTFLKPGMWIAEPGLWLQWENQGELTAVSHSVLLAIDAKDFEQVLSEYKGSGVYATGVMYA